VYRESIKCTCVSSLSVAFSVIAGRILYYLSRAVSLFLMRGVFAEM